MKMTIFLDIMIIFVRGVIRFPSPLGDRVNIDKHFVQYQPILSSSAPCACFCITAITQPFQAEMWCTLCQDKKMALKKALRNVNLALKIAYRTWIWLSKPLTGRESGHQIFLPDMLFFVKIFDQTTIPDLKFWMICLSVCSCPRPDCNVSAVSLWYVFVSIDSTDRRGEKLT